MLESCGIRNNLWLSISPPTFASTSQNLVTVPSPLDTTLINDTVDAAKRLRAGQLVAFPTETVYGLGAYALDPIAVAGIFEAKSRPDFDPLIVHLADIEQIGTVARQVPDVALALADQFWPGPLTLILPKCDAIPDLVTSGLQGVGVRIPRHNVARQLLREADCPVAAPSANPFGGVSPTTAAHVLQGLSGRIDAVLDGGPCPVGVESTVVSLMDDRPIVLRLGGLPLEALEEVTGPIEVACVDPQKDDAAQPAPGMLSRHYAPGTPVVLVESEAVIHSAGPQTALLTWGMRSAEGDFLAVECLSGTGDLQECAANFFAALRSLDAANPDVIIARRFPDHGLGRTLNDRLERASG